VFEKPKRSSYTFAFTSSRSTTPGLDTKAAAENMRLRSEVPRDEAVRANRSTSPNWEEEASEGWR
jgi:hypothetical protein